MSTLWTGFPEVALKHTSEGVILPASFGRKLTLVWGVEKCDVAINSQV